MSEPECQMLTATYRRGQVVAFPRAPSGTAQVDELLRTRVVVLYRRRGKVCRRAVHVRRLDVIQRCHQMLPGFPEPEPNPLGRGYPSRGREKSYLFEER